MWLPLCSGQSLKSFRSSIMSHDDSFRKLRIVQAYTKLLCLPENAQGARTVLLERIGNYEIRIFEASQSGASDAPLFCMELFDCDEQLSIDSCCCEIEEAVTAFDALIAQAKYLNELSSREGSQPQS
jgi:hypothetical protein